MIMLPDGAIEKIAEGFEALQDLATGWANYSNAALLTGDVNVQALNVSSEDERALILRARNGMKCLRKMRADGYIREPLYLKVIPRR